MKTVRQRIACKAVIEHNGRILILRESQNYRDGTHAGRYHLPGGRIELGEPYLEGLTREIKEETGLEVVIKQPFFVGEWWPVIGGKKNQIVAVFFHCSTVNNKVVLSGEHDAYEWIAPGSYTALDLVDPEPEVLQTFCQMNGFGQN